LCTPWLVFPEQRRAHSGGTRRNARSCGNSLVYFNLGYCKLRRWWAAGLVTLLLQGTCWVVVGGVWWQVLGLWDVAQTAGP
jgi:hypothetical protein